MALLRTSLRARRTMTTVTAASCLLLGAAAAANAAPQGELSPPKVLSAENAFAEAADIAVRDDGSAVAVWTQTKNGAGPATVQVALQDSAGRWGQPTTLSESTSNAQRPAVATNGHDVAVTWEQGSAKGSRIMVAEFDGTWAKPQLISSSGATNPELVVNAKGTTSVTWLHNSKNAPTSVEFAQETTAGKFRAQQLTNKSESAVSQSMTVSESGQVSVVWYSLDDSYHVRASTPSNSAKTSPVTLSSSQLRTEAVEPAVATRAGKTIAVWQETLSDTSQHIAYATMTAAGRWSAAAPLPEADGGAANPQVGVDGSGRATVLWIKSGKCDQGMVSEQRADGTWKQAEQITESDRDNDGLRLDVAPDGRAVAAWPGIDPGDYPYRPPAQVNVRDADGKWTGVKSLSAAGNKCFDPIAKINDNGAIAAIWSLGNGESTSRVEAVTSLTPR
ncbi:MAG TPA: hypothetical protein DCQ04_15445 [Actinobacteria bacterium]|nr:hypothetical protein [Actinomycetota bacterium]